MPWPRVFDGHNIRCTEHAIPAYNLVVPVGRTNYFGGGGVKKITLYLPTQTTIKPKNILQGEWGKVVGKTIKTLYF